MRLIHILFENHLEEEAICYYLEDNGYFVTVYDKVETLTETMSKSKDTGIYLMDIQTVSRLTDTERDHSYIDLKVIVIGSLQHLYILFESTFRQMAYVTRKESISEMLKSMEDFHGRRIQISKRVYNFLKRRRLVQQIKLLDVKFDKPLTKTEIQLLMEIGQGKTTQEIAIEWYRSTHTINNHRKNLIKKLGIGEKFSLAVFAAKKIDSIQTLNSIDKLRSSWVKKLKQK